MAIIFGTGFSYLALAIGQLLTKTLTITTPSYIYVCGDEHISTISMISSTGCTVSIGSAPGARDIVDNAEVNTLTGSVEYPGWRDEAINRTFKAGDTLHFSGCAGTLTVKLRS